MGVTARDSLKFLCLTPGPGEVLLKVAAAGLCHSDLHLMEWPDGVLPYDLPFTLGHENAGHVAAVGSGVTNVVRGPGRDRLRSLGLRLLLAVCAGHGEHL